MDILFSQLTGIDAALTNILGMYLCQHPQTVVRYGEAGRDDHMLHYHLSGTRSYRFNGQQLFLSSGDIVLLPRGFCYTSAVEGEKDAVGYNVRFMLHTADGQPIYFTDPLSVLFKDHEKKLLPSFQALTNLALKTENRLKSAAVLAEMLDRLIAWQRSSHSKDWLSVVIAYMGEHLQAPLSLERLSALCHMSERTFLRQFKEATGQTPIAWHRHLRTVKAQEFLDSGLFTLDSAAELFGFTDASHLSRCLRREAGKMPRARP